MVAVGAMTFSNMTIDGCYIEESGAILDCKVKSNDAGPGYWVAGSTFYALLVTYSVFVAQSFWRPALLAYSDHGGSP